MMKQSANDTASYSAQRQIDAVCDAFEAAWANVPRPKIEDFLDSFSAQHRPAALRELVVLDIYLRGQQGETVTFAEYVSRFPDLPSASFTSLLADERPTIPGFEIERELGRGGMGIVYLARQLTLDRLVAIKMVIDGALTSPERRLRFLFEAELAARVRHPNVVAIHDVAAHAGRPYLVLEYVDGGSLADRLANGRPTYREAAALVATLADGIHAAHIQGVIHRDLKPGNILLTREGSNPKVTDFGLARNRHRSSDLTLTGHVLGTPGYMAPEQAAGEKNVSPAVDVYSLGAILYECLTGRRPFVGKTTDEVISRLLHDAPVHPRSIVGNIPRDLEVVCLKCLEKEPARRYATAGDLAVDLRNVLAGRPVTARPISIPESALRWCRRRPAVAGMLIMSLIGVVAATFGMAYHTRQLNQSLVSETAARNAAAAAAIQSRERLELALDGYRNIVQQFRELGRDPATRPAQQKLLAVAITGLEKIAASYEGREPDYHRAEAHRQIAVIYWDLGRNRECIEQHEKCAEIARSLLSRSPRSVSFGILLGNALFGMLDPAMRLDRTDFAIATAIEGCKVLKDCFEFNPDDLGVLNCLCQINAKLAHIYTWKRDTRSARATLETGLPWVRDLQSRKPEDNDTLLILNNHYDQLAALADAEKDWERAYAMTSEQATVAREMLRRQPDDAACRRRLLVAIGNLGIYLSELNRDAEAFPKYVEAEALARSVANSDAGNTSVQCEWAMSLSQLGTIELKAGLKSDAKKHLIQSHDILVRLRDAGRLADHPQVLRELLPQVEQTLAKLSPN
ncbi:MAG: serine/threonine protein kinase [Gemmataceae bacterium]|nr:serine/threonine protein kinase [Gemmataceae bacterium]